MGVAEHIFDVNLHGKVVTWHLFDVGGARGQRHSWVPYFDDANAIIFVAPVSAFDQVSQRNMFTWFDTFVGFTYLRCFWFNWASLTRSLLVPRRRSSNQPHRRFATTVHPDLLKCLAQERTSGAIPEYATPTYPSIPVCV